MNEYIVYSRDNCPWCVRAKELLQSKNIPFKELKLGVDYDKEELRSKMGGIARLTVPQIFNGEDYVGNYEGLRNLIEKGEL